MDDTPGDTITAESALFTIAISAVAFSVVLAAVLFIILPDMHRYGRLAASGVDGTATITGHHERSGKAGKTHFVSYTYTVEGRNYLGEDSLMQQASEPPTAGRIGIVYDPTEPGISAVESGGDFIRLRYERTIHALELFGGFPILGMVIVILVIASKLPARGET